MLGLRQHVGGECTRIAVGGDDQDLGGPGDEIDADFAGQQFLGGGDVDVAGADDAIGARHGARAEGEGRDGLRAAHLKDVVHAQQVARCRRFRRPASGTRRRCSARRPPAPESPSSSAWRAADSGPRECRRPRYRAGGRSGRACRPGGVCAVHSRGSWRCGVGADVGGGGLHGGAEFGRQGLAGGAQFGLRARARSCARGGRTCARIPAARDRRACGRLPESAAPRPRLR